MFQWRSGDQSVEPGGPGSLLVPSPLRPCKKRSLPAAGCRILAVSARVRVLLSYATAPADSAWLQALILKVNRKRLLLENDATY
jgi:hypothetical protein